MATRHVMAEQGAVYRAVITWTEVPEKGGTPHTEYQGPYATAAAAQSQVTFWENHLRNFDTGETRATGRVEEGVVTEWKPYTRPARKTRRKGDRA